MSIIITGQPIGGSSCVSETYEFVCSGESDVPEETVHFQWYSVYYGEGQPPEYTLINTVGDTLILSDISFSDQSFYACRVYTDNEEVWSDIVFLEVLNKIEITSQPVGEARYEGKDVTFSLEIVEGITYEVQYQWYFNSTPLLNKTSNILEINNLELDNSGIYHCNISSSYGENINTDGITLIVVEYGEGYSTIKPICIIYPVGRGSYYNLYSIKIEKSLNPLNFEGYQLDLYKNYDTDDEEILESFIISFNSEDKEINGDSVFISDVLNRYSKEIRCMFLRSNGEYADGYKQGIQKYDQNIGNVILTLSTIEDSKQDFTMWFPVDNISQYCIIVKDDKNNEIYAWIGNSVSDDNNEKVYIFQDKEMTQQGWNNILDLFRWSSKITYEIKKSYNPIENLFTSIVSLKKGSEGSLMTRGEINSSVATTVLENSYSGTLVSPYFDDNLPMKILDVDSIYFSLVFDAGYPSSVKISISNLAESRGDCLAIIDNNDNKLVSESLTRRKTLNKFLSYYTAIYEPYTKIKDIFLERDIWISPVYHMAYTLSKSEKITEIWNQAAGYECLLNSIKDLRYYPSDSEKDQLYQNNLNCLLKFMGGVVPFSQITTEIKLDSMKDINVVRTILYCKTAISRYCKFYIFKNNDSSTWESVTRDINIFLGDVQKSRGLYSYSVEVSATEKEIQQRKFHINVILEALRGIDKIELNFYIKH
jgi:hypothetical protein